MWQFLFYKSLNASSFYCTFNYEIKEKRLKPNHFLNSKPTDNISFQNSSLKALFPVNKYTYISRTIIGFAKNKSTAWFMI